jgi:hypothetical protein
MRCILSSLSHLIKPLAPSTQQRLAGALILLDQTAYIPYITDMTIIGKLAFAPGSTAFFKNFAPGDVSSTDVHFVGVMGIFSIIPHGLAFMGSIAFMAFSMYAYHSGKPQDRGAMYYRGRQRFYCALLLIAGLVQLALGAYLSIHFETGKGGRFTYSGAEDNARPYVGVAMFIINIPAIAVFVGGIQCMNALWGMQRSCSNRISKSDDLSPRGDWAYQACIYAGWFLQVILQAVVQIGLQGPVPAAAAIVGVTFALNLMPAFLDYKSRTAPFEIDAAQYYGLTMTDNMETRKEFAPTRMQSNGSNASAVFDA